MFCNIRQSLLHHYFQAELIMQLIGTLFSNTKLSCRKQKECAAPFGAVYTKYDPEVILLNLLCAKNVLVNSAKNLLREPLVKLQNTKVLLH